MKRFLTLLALPLLFIACSTDTGDRDLKFNDSVGKFLTAGFDTDVRTYVEDGAYLRWHADDRITAFYGNTLNREYRFMGNTGDNSGRFELITDGYLGTGNALGKIYAIYPFNSAATITDMGVISYTLPAIQHYAPNSFGVGANTMLAVTESLEDTFLAFKNVGGYLKICMYGDATISNIVLRGNNNEPLAGAVTITKSSDGVPSVEMGVNTTTQITLDCDEGVKLGTTAQTATEFWFVLPETTFTAGITIVATDTSGNSFEQSTSKIVEIQRNCIQPMAAIEFKEENGDAEPTPVTATLTYEECQDIIAGYKNPQTYTNEYGSWIVCAYGDAGDIQINKGKVAYIGTPTFAGDITKIEIEFHKSYSGSIYLCSEPGSTSATGVIETIGCSGSSMEHTLTTVGLKSFYIRSSACANINAIHITYGGGNSTPEPDPEPEPEPEEPEQPDTPIVNDGIIGGWHIKSFCGGEADVDIYMQLNSDKTFLLYQRTNSVTFVKYNGTYSLDEVNSIISGVYSDGVQWANSYKYSINTNSELVFVNTLNAAEITIYEPSSMPTIMAESVSRATILSNIRPL